MELLVAVITIVMVIRKDQVLKGKLVDVDEYANKRAHRLEGVVV